LNAVQSEEGYRVICTAARLRQPIAATYEGAQRRLCPYVVGHNDAGECRVFCYQYGGDSRSEPYLGGKAGVWRCLSLTRISRVELLNDEWRSEAHSPQHCVKHVEVDADAGAYAAGDPQNGQ